MKRIGRRHRPCFRICAIDKRAPRDGKVIEELGHYDPMVKETDARVTLKAERIDYWLGVGAQPSEKVKVLIKKYGTGGTHLEQQKAALERLSIRPQAPEPVAIPLPKTEEPAPVEEAVSAAAAPVEVPAEAAPAEAPAEESQAKDATQEVSGAESSE
jgi:small subunit ribosomal protein S16